LPNILTAVVNFSRCKVWFRIQWFYLQWLENVVTWFHASAVV